MITPIPAGADEARRLTAISRALTYARSFDEVLDLTVDCAREFLGASRVLLLLNDDEDGLLRIRASRGIDREVIERFREPLDETLLARLEELLGPDAKAHFLGVPLVVQGAVMGLLAVRRGDGEETQEDEEWLLSALADQAAVALESTRHRRVRHALEHRLDQLESDSRQKGEALQVLSHDLRSPLSALQSYAALMAGEILGTVNDRQREALGRIRGICDHLDSIISTVVELAKLTEGRPEIRSDPVRVKDAVERSMDVVRPSADDARIELATDGSPSDELRTDPGRLRQVLVQLLDNAVKYSPDGKTVRVEWKVVESDGRRWEEISVIDQGPGVPHDLQETIFQPYVRQDDLAETDSERARSGVGLGLAIARSVVEHLEGTLSLESEPGHGSTFRVRLPLERAH